MVLRRKEIELTVEQELPAGTDGAPRRARLTARLESEPADAAATPEELRTALRGLADELVRAVEGWGPSSAGQLHVERTLAELVEAYRPRQPELVELLHEEGELSDREYELLRTNVGSPAAAGSPAAERRTGGETPVPSPAGSSNDPRARFAPRPVPELLRTYQIASLRQAGAVRARRQISFEEYMALKKHFVTSETDARGDSAGAGSPHA